MISVSATLVDEMVDHSMKNLPDEACGLLALAENRVQRVYCVENVTPSPHHFTVDPIGHRDAFLDADGMGWEIAGSFHSHPAGNIDPSETDIARSPGREWLHVIIGTTGPRPKLGFYRIGTRVVSCRFQITD